MMHTMLIDVLLELGLIIYPLKFRLDLQLLLKVMKTGLMTGMKWRRNQKNLTHLMTESMITGITDTKHPVL